MSTLIIGITGGIGSGKTAVTDYLASLGITIVDADQAARVVVKPGTPALQAIAEHFGEQILQEDGGLDRRALRNIIFNNNEERRWLETLLHPLIKDEMLNQLSLSQSPYSVIVSPLLLETDQHTMVDRIAVVDIPAELQVQRTMARDGIEQSQAEAIMNAQAARETRLAQADDVIDNSGSLDDLHQVLDQLHNTWRAIAAKRSSD
ncbi:dephospho-CoA kinase [Kistimonas asteriae]|uniref:dephospho-CoA kinase n=1 Tax=Kistimonas asteriae TaxID=517724 RepID=UPI001BABC08D|nr:dephospho-CoA kinase [Kistimonas asteriae]